MMAVMAEEALYAAVCAAVLVCACAAYVATTTRVRFQLDGKVIIITGAASGIGKRLAQTIVARSPNAILVLLDIDTAALLRVQQNLTDLGRTGEGAVLAFACDVSDHSAVNECITQAKKALAPKRIDVLVNNAGIVHGRSIDHLTPEQLRRTFEVNTLGQIWMTKAILPEMKKSGHEAMIVSVASVMGLISGANLADYCASKAAVCAFHDCMRLELWRDGFRNIATLLVCPNAVDTGMFEGIMQGNSWTARLSRLLLPTSSEQQAADRIYNAMQRREQFVVSCYTGWRGVVVPWLPAVARLLPSSWFDYVVYLGGGVAGMDTFVGRQKKKGE